MAILVGPITIYLAVTELILIRDALALHTVLIPCEFMSTSYFYGS